MFEPNERTDLIEYIKNHVSVVSILFVYYYILSTTPVECIQTRRAASLLLALGRGFSFKKASLYKAGLNYEFGTLAVALAKMEATHLEPESTWRSLPSQAASTP